MQKLQIFLKLDKYIDYKTKIRFDSKKGFYCQITSSNSTKCLGKSKGRIYPEMDAAAMKYLQDYYMHHNVVLSKLFSRLRMPIPLWLESELTTNF